jgi:hypothetical protein
MWTRGVIVVGAAALLLALGAPSFAAEAVGKAVALTPSAAGGSSGTGTLQVDDPVFMGDRVTTGKTGQVQLAFVDSTRMIVGPSSQLTIDSFVFQGQATAGHFSVNAVRGAFRFITGQSPKRAYVINTPTATLGVQGTRFDFSVEKDGRTNLALYEGSVRLCDKTRPQRCTILSGACSVVSIGPSEDFRAIKDLNQRKAFMDKAFPFAFKQNGLLSNFRVNSKGCSATYSIEAPRSGSSNPIIQSPSPPAPPPPPNNPFGGGGGQGEGGGGKGGRI